MLHCNVALPIPHHLCSLSATLTILCGLFALYACKFQRWDLYPFGNETKENPVYAKTQGVKQQVETCLICSNSKWILLKSSCRKNPVTVFSCDVRASAFQPLISTAFFPTAATPPPPPTSTHTHKHKNNTLPSTLAKCFPNCWNIWRSVLRNDCEYVCVCMCELFVCKGPVMYLQLDAVSSRACNCMHACMCVCMVCMQILCWAEEESMLWLMTLIRLPVSSRKNRERE